MNSIEIPVSTFADAVRLEHESKKFIFKDINDGSFDITKCSEIPVVSNPGGEVSLYVEEQDTVINVYRNGYQDYNL